MCCAPLNHVNKDQIVSLPRRLRTHPFLWHQIHWERSIYERRGNSFSDESFLLSSQSDPQVRLLDWLGYRSVSWEESESMVEQGIPLVDWFSWTQPGMSLAKSSGIGLLFLWGKGREWPIFMSIRESWRIFSFIRLAPVPIDDRRWSKQQLVSKIYISISLVIMPELWFFLVICGTRIPSPTPSQSIASLPAIFYWWHSFLDLICRWTRPNWISSRPPYALK